jgi:hypothetical protein
MSTRSRTCGCPPARVEPSNTGGNPESSSEYMVAQALSMIAEMLQHITGSNRLEEHWPETEIDQALERFLRFHPPLFHRKSDLEQAKQKNKEGFRPLIPKRLGQSEWPPQNRYLRQGNSTAPRNPVRCFHCSKKGHKVDECF